MIDPVVQFIQMSVVDHQIQITRAQIEHLQKQIVNAKHDSELNKKSIQELQQQLFNFKKDLFAQEHQLLALQEREKNKIGALEACSSPKEYQLLQNELTVLATQKNTFEDHVVQLMVELEDFEKTVQKQQPQLELVATQLLAMFNDLNQQLINANESLHTLEQNRLKLLTQFPTEWLGEYERARASFPNPCVPVVNNLCTGCFHALTESELANLRRKRLIRCSDCFRFLVQEKEWISN